MLISAFRPIGNTKEIDVTSSSSTAKAFTGTGMHYQFVNAGTKACFVALTTDGAAAVIPTNSTDANALPVLSGEIVVYTGPPAAQVTAICAGSDSTSLYVTQGEGI